MRSFFIIILLFVCMAVTSCRVARYAGEGRAVVSRSEVRVNGEPTKDDQLLLAIEQRPYRRTFGFLPISAWIWHPDTTSGWHKLRNRLGTAPTIFEDAKAVRTDHKMQTLMRQKGYLDAVASHTMVPRNGKAEVIYHILSGQPRYVASLSYVANDSAIQQLIDATAADRLPQVGQNLDQNLLGVELQRLTSLLRDNGYWDFGKDQITFLVDTLAGSGAVDVTCVLTGTNRPWRIRHVNWRGNDSVLRDKVLQSNSFIQEGMLYSERAERETRASLTRLRALRYVNVRIEQVPDADHLLDYVIELTPQSRHSIQLELDGTNTAGDLGASLGAIYQHHNVFHGSESFRTHLKGSYEALSGNLDKLVNKHYQELSANFSLDFPQFLFPFINDDVRRRSRATTLIQASFSTQSRPEYSRNVMQGSVAYKWNGPSGKSRHIFDVVNLSYVHLPEQSETFKQLIQNLGPLIYSSYTSHLIMSMDYNLYMGNNTRTTGREQQTKLDLWSLRINPEIAGNALSVLSHMTGAQKKGEERHRYHMLGQPYEQYVRFDIDWSYSHYLTDRSRLALHAAGGFAMPYGNSDVMPFEKRYYSGGANSVRGWSVRELGPGTYATGKSNFNYFNQCGDIRLDASVELRSRLVWKLESAFFLDAGNVWTIREYANQPGGQFTSRFYRQIASSWGVGLRYVSDLMVLRVDWGFKAFDPSSDADEAWAIRHPFRGNHNTFHFAVGYPF